MLSVVGEVVTGLGFMVVDGWSGGGRGEEKREEVGKGKKNI